MPQFFRASVFQPIARTRNAEVVRDTAKPAGGGTSPNGNTIVYASDTLLTSAVLRNIDNIAVPASTRVMWYGYSDDVDLTLTGFPLEAGASIALEAAKTVYAVSGDGATVPYAVDKGEE